MKVFTDTSENIDSKKAVVTVGSFDGLHPGHFKILDEVKRAAAEKDGDAFVVTFEPHPRLVLSKDFNLKILTTLQEKKEILANAGIENLIVINFTREFSQLNSDEFIKKFIVDKLKAVRMVIGHDHKFGRDRLGDVVKLNEVGKFYNFDVTDVPAVSLNGEIISSTKIRNALFEGNIDRASLFLGRNYSLSGKIVLGAQRGRTLGFPTANLALDETLKAVPKNGVYTVKCYLGGEVHIGIMNIGYRPTFENIQEMVLEVHLLNFSRDIYGESMKVEFLRRLRDEVKFESKDSLINQIEIDKREAQKENI
ncbi:MAG: bifunctional riboflavin kinase/FAD synthetase [Melioribacteraceae bacterium]